nr:galactokinase-like isoform X4 [Malus domestica]
MTQMAKHEELPIPIHNTLDAVYGDSSQLDEAQLRFHQLKSKFQQVGHPPHLFARSSGRVNLIGEHIDYERYSMLPMAIRQDTVVAIRKHDDGDAAKVLRIANVNDKYQICTYPADPTQEIDLKNHIGALFHLWKVMVYVVVHVQMFLRICQIEGRKCWTSTIEILLEFGLRIYRLLSHMQLIQHLGKMTVQMRNLPLKSRKLRGR